MFFDTLASTIVILNIKNAMLHTERTCEIHEDSAAIWWIKQDAARFSKILRDSARHCEDLQVSARLCGYVGIL